MNTHVGFEFEFTSALDDDELVSQLKSAGLRIRANAGRNSWGLGGDGSVSSRRRSRGRNWQSYELRSPVMPLDVSLDALKSVFDLLASIPCDINSTCGLHVNMDIGRLPTRTIDPVKLVMLVDDLNIAKRYGRSRNAYSLPRATQIGRTARRWRKLKTKHNSLKEYVKVQGVDVNEKYSAINFSHVRSRGYVEFRMIGNKNYHQRYTEIRRDILHFQQCMIKSADHTLGELALSRRLNKLAA